MVGFASLSLPDNMQAPSPLVPALKSNWLMMHVTVMMLSYASLIVGSLLGVLFLILTQGKKENIVLQGNSYGNNFSSTNLGNTAFYKEDSVETYSNLFVKENNGEKNLRNDRLSFLESLDNLSYRTISFGFPLLTIGIIAGVVWANEAWALITCTWLVFASYLHPRITKAWQGPKPAMIASLGFYSGVDLLFRLAKGWHTYRSFNGNLQSRFLHIKLTL